MIPIPDAGDNWICPYCGRHQAVAEKRWGETEAGVFNDQGEFGRTGVKVLSIVCANNACRKMTLVASLHTRHYSNSGNMVLGDKIMEWQLLPESSAMPLPDYIPEPIRDDYTQACRIRDLSPKASATMSRRCLQGMIRDFCGISGRRLIDEIDALRDQVDNGKAPLGVQPDSVTAIDHVRGIGNIGAHMEADINVIIDVDPDEAQQLIVLIELLCEEWYIARHHRAERLTAIGVIA